MRIQITKKAKKDLLEIYEYYKLKGNGILGRSIGAKITRKALTLRDFPELGREEEALKDLGLGHRFLVEGNYKIIYRRENDKIIVTDIFNTLQDPEKLG